VAVVNGKPAEIACLSLMPIWESDMARPKQSEASLSLDRRQWLASAAAVTAAGIVPNAKSAGATNSAQAVKVTKIPDVPALKVCAGTAQKIQEIASRNIIRAEAGLPLLSIPKELRRMKQVADARKFEEFADQHRQAVCDEVLASARQARGNRQWRPTRLMEGYAFQAQVRKALRARFEATRTSARHKLGT
jgi:hypothetical protein